MEQAPQINYGWLYDTMVINQDCKITVARVAMAIMSSTKRYADFAKSFNPSMPWYAVGILHMMECSGNFHQHLHNGDPLTHRTTHVPAGRPIADPKNKYGIGYSWEESAADALTMKGWNVPASWTNEELLSRFERYNGMGYLRHNINTPYLWSETNHYTKGKFIADDEFDPDALSKQTGAAALLKTILDKITIPSTIL